MVDGSDLFHECIKHLHTCVCVWKQLIDLDGGVWKADNVRPDITPLIDVDNSEIVPDQ